MKEFYILLGLFGQCFSATAGLFDLAELRQVSYDANIGENSLWFAPGLKIDEVTPENIDDLEKKITNKIPDESQDSYLFVTSKGGQKFACSLPEVVLKKDLPKTSKNPKVYNDAIAASFYVDKCIRLRGTHWWSYILCRGQTVEQIHGEPGQEGYAKNILGLFDGTLRMPPFQESTEDRLLYVEESYTSGTFCDLEEYKEPRRTTVRYECDIRLSTNEAYVHSVVEVKPCQYLMIARIGTLCHFPEFLPASQANTKNIQCQPYLKKSEIRSLLERQIVKKSKKAMLETEMTVASHKFRRTVDRFTALTKSQRTLHLPDLQKKINAEIDYRGAHFDLIHANLKSSGVPMSSKKLDAIYNLLSSVDTADYLQYMDYDTIDDENRGHLWYYFHDPLWPKNQFPKDITTTAIQNKYIEEVQKNLKGDYVFDEDGDYVIGLSRFLITGKVDLNSNLVLSALDIYDDIADHGLKAVAKKHRWLQLFYQFFLDREDVLVERLVEKLSDPKNEDENSMSALGNLAMVAVSDLYNDIDIDLDQLAVNGRLKSDDYDEDWYSIDIYRTINAVKQKPSNAKGSLKYRLEFLSNELETYRELEYDFERVLTPLYQLISILWFQRKTPNYFETRPRSIELLARSPESDYYKFHKNLAVDFKMLAKMLARAIVLKMEYYIETQQKKNEDSFRLSDFEDFWDVEEDLEEVLSLDNEEILTVLFDFYGKEIILESKLRLWERKIMQYKTNHFIEDYKMRKEAKSLQGLMNDILSTEGDYEHLFSIGGASKNRKQKGLEDELLKKLKNLLNFSLDDLDNQSDTFSEEINEYFQDDGFYEMSQMKDFFEMLEKAGLSKDAKVEIKLIDADGNEIIGNEQLDAMAETLFDQVEAHNRFQKTQEAYSTSVLKDSDEENEKKE